MKWKITRNFIFAIVTVVVLVAIINIITAIYVIGTTQFLNTIDSKNNPEEFVRTFQSYLYEENNQLVLSQEGIDKLEKTNSWIQALNDSGNEVYGFNTPKDIKTSYTPFQLINNYKYVKTKYITFMLEKQVNNEHLNILIGVPNDTVSRIIFTYSVNTIVGIIKKISILIVIIDVIIALIISYLFSRKLTKPISNIILDIDTLSNGNYNLNSKEKGIYKEVFENVNILSDTLRKNEEEAKENEVMREEWLANISHDIKTPLASIQGYAEIISDKDYDFSKEEIDEYAEIIYGKSKYIKELVDDLNLSTRLKNNTLILNKQSINLVTLVRDIIIDILNDSRYEHKDIEFITEEKVVEKEVDVILLRRAITNLIFNAIVHNNDDVSIVVELKKDYTKTEIIIRDNGRGISEKDLKHIFDRYYRGTNTGEAHKGSGLGMAISKEIINNHGWEIELKSKIEQGTEIIVTL